MPNKTIGLSAQKYSTQELEKLAKDAYSYENRDAHGKANLNTEYIGTLERGNRLYDLYLDTERNAWYTLRYMTEKGPVSEYEYIFGHKEPRLRRKKNEVRY